MDGMNLGPRPLRTELPETIVVASAGVEVQRDPDVHERRTNMKHFGLRLAAKDGEELTYLPLWLQLEYAGDGGNYILQALWKTTCCDAKSLHLDRFSSKHRKADGDRTFCKGCEQETPVHSNPSIIGTNIKRLPGSLHDNLFAYVERFLSSAYESTPLEEVLTYAEVTQTIFPIAEHLVAEGNLDVYGKAELVH